MQHAGAIVVGVGSGEESHLQVDWAAREAQLRDRPLHLIRAYRLIAATVPWETEFDRTMIKQLQQDAEQVLDVARARVAGDFTGVTVESFAVDGPAARVLGEASEEAELTVVGSRRLSAIGTTVLGSVSTVVASTGPGPVVVVRRPTGDATLRPRVVVGVDGSSATSDVLDFAFDYASRHQRELNAVFCWQPDLLATMRWRGEPQAPGRAERWLAEALAGWTDRYPDVTVHRAVLRAHAVAGLVTESLSQDLLVVGARSRHVRLAGLLGATSQGVLHHATCPVAVVHPR